MTSKIANISTEQNYTEEFHQACFKGDFESASLLLRMGVNLNVRFEFGQNLLHIACIQNFYGLVQLLIKFGCNEFIKDNFGRTPLHYAALKGGISIARYLVERNTFRYGLNNTYTDLGNLKILLTKEFLDCQDNEGKTAVYYACEQNQEEILLIILSSGLADINIEDLDKQSPLVITYKKKYWDIFELLIKNGAHVNYEILKEICIQGDSLTANILLKYMNNSTLKLWKVLVDENKNSYLYLAIKFSYNIDFIKLMLENDVKLNAKDVKDFLKNMRDLKKNFNSNFFGCAFKERFLHYIECLVLFLKYNCFDFNLKPSVIFNYFTDLNSDEYLLATQFGESTCSSFLIMLFLDLVFFIYLNIEDELFRKKIESRIIYLFALAIYSSQLDCRKKIVQTWFHKLGNKNQVINQLSELDWMY